MFIWGQFTFSTLGQIPGAETNEQIALVGSSLAPANPVALWYRQPAAKWREALPIGNGRLGGMVWGRVQHERIDLNEDTLWTGEPGENLNTNGLAALPAVRALLLAGKNAEAQALVEQKMNGHYDSSYLPMGQLKFEFPLSGEVSDYRRELDIAQAVARVEFTHDGARYTRELFASHPAQAIVVRLTSDRPGRISFVASLDSPLRYELGARGIVLRPETHAPVLRLIGRCPAYVDPNFLGKKVVYDDAPGGKGMRFEIQLAGANQGGRLTITTNSIAAENCDSVTLLLVAATSFNGPRQSPSLEGKDPAKLCDDYLAPLAGKSYSELRKAHIADYQSLFNRVQLDFNIPHSAFRTPHSFPTDERLAHYEPGKDPSLAALYYQCGRYLLISCSRPGGQPSNLQGLWNYQLQPAWSANWTLNCNAEINYWPVEAANLGECHLPLIDLTEELSVDGEHIARDLYGARGWVAHHNTDLWRQAGPVGGSACWSMFPVGSAWLCQHLWEHYAFTGDTNYLARVWPTMRDATRFYLDYLIEEPTHHWLVTGPDINFENHWRKPDGETGCTCLGPTASMQMIRELFRNCLATMDTLGLEDRPRAILPLPKGAGRGEGNSESTTGTDDARLFRAEIEAALPRLAPMQISPTTGELQEWLEDWQRTAECQVLSSWGLICSAQITPRGTPELAAALRKIFDSNPWWKQGKVGSWQGAFQANAYARLGDGDTALAILETHLKSSVNPNLTASFPGHTQYQIDGNLGMTAAINEMLLQSQETADETSGSRLQTSALRTQPPVSRVYQIHLLPALPKEWAGGAVKGLRARGGFEVDMTWKDGRLTRAVIHSLLGNPCQVRLGEKVVDLNTKRGKSYTFNGNL